MTQLVVTLDDSQPLQSVRKAINMLKDVMTTAIVKKQNSSTSAEQKAYVKVTLGNALKEENEAKKHGQELQSLDSFIDELKAGSNGNGN